MLVALLFVMAGVCGKFGALLTMMPDPILGGVLVVGLGMVSAVGISNLQFVDMASSRNQCIIGLSLMMGMMLPNWLKKNTDAINTGKFNTAMPGTPIAQLLEHKIANLRVSSLSPAWGTGRHWHHGCLTIA